MRFGLIPTSEAVGAILAHSLPLADGTLKKGRMLTATDCERLLKAGSSVVMAARLEAGDVGEDEAARRVAALLAGAGTRASAPFTGRANVYADAAGVLTLEPAIIDRLNAIEEGLTVATLAPGERVGAGQMVATVKVITFAVPEQAVAAAEALLRGHPPLVVHTFRAACAGLVLTRLTGTRPSVLAKRERAIRQRLEALGASVAPSLTVPHETAAVAEAVGALAAAGLDPIIVFAASAIVDRADVIPAALLAAGGAIERLGMPVDPGNLMLLGRLGSATVIGAPSCAASPKLNGFDWVLERRLAGLDVTSGEVARMGVGGLLKEIETRPQPRAGAIETDRDGEPADTGRRALRVAAIVLAAGRSTRFGTANKLTAILAGRPLVAHAAAAALASRASPVIVITGHEVEAVTAALKGYEVTFVHNPDYASGLATSLRAGLAAVPASCDGAIICLGDMPGIRADHIDRLIAALEPKEGRSIVTPVHRGKRGNPVLFARRHFAELMADVAGDSGARHVIGRHQDEVVEVDLGTEAIFLDVDTPAALAAARPTEN